MWCCGTRTKETRTLLCKNVNLDQGYIDIINSKGNKDRRIYLSEEFRSYLSAYDNKMKLLRPNRSYFFSGGRDFSPISERKITENFKVIWYTAFPDFDRSIRIRLYDYEKVGMMDVVSLMDAESQLKTPDDFDIRTSNLAQDNKVDILKVENVYQRLVNQHSNGCEILQPIYFFKGTATLEDNTQAEFSSKIIAIPESMTYED
jgi:hypothetical protein